MVNRRKPNFTENLLKWRVSLKSFLRNLKFRMKCVSFHVFEKSWQPNGELYEMISWIWIRMLFATAPVEFIRSLWIFMHHRWNLIYTLLIFVAHDSDFWFLVHTIFGLKNFFSFGPLFGCFLKLEFRNWPWNVVHDLWCISKNSIRFEFWPYWFFFRFSFTLLQI